MEERKKETSQKIGKRGNQIENLGREKMASKPASKQKNSGTITQILKSNGCKGKKKGKRTRKKVETEKYQSKRKTTRRVNQS